ncbi:MAG TPA: ABC transporter permease [Ideonella sp.]|nr:ABC transporter permease [Ideonella sp.]
MFAYYIDLALRSLQRSKALTVLMVLAMALGIGASMTTLTVFHALSGDPMPGRSDKLYYVQLDAADLSGFVPGAEPYDQMTRFDAETLLREKRADRQAMMSGGSVALQPAASGQAALEPFYAAARYTSADFFPMFDTPFAHGRAWGAADDDSRARVVVISQELNQKLFGGADSTGKPLRLDDAEFRIVGVLKAWRPVPHFYDLNTGRYTQAEQVYLPFSTARDLKLGHDGSMRCWGQGEADATALNRSCAWIQYWAELDTPAKAAAYREDLVRYAEQQKAAGRFQRPPNERLRPLMAWLDFKKVVPSDVRLQLWLAFGFLLVCLVNTVGLLLAKCLRRSAEIGVRRALGASRLAIFTQFLVEAGMIGLAGGLLGLVLAMGGLWLVRQNPAAYAQLARLDGAMLLLTFVLALAASVIAGLLPAWRACQVTPALQLKSQ